MRDNQELMIKLAKIIENYPEIYDHNSEAYKTRQRDVAWEKVVSCVRNELKEECTVEELKAKWKGIRSSFNRYKNRIINLSDSTPYKKYYLYDTLKFLDPFTRPKGPVLKESGFEEFGLCENDSKPNENKSLDDEWMDVTETKFEISNCGNQTDPLNIQSINYRNKSEKVESEFCLVKRKRRHSSEDKGTDDENEDLQFFKSILPDIRDFTNREKRKLKMGILKLIDDLENERKQQ